MILHTGIDGGLHDLLLANGLAVLAWGCLAVNATIYYARRAVRALRSVRNRGRK